MSAENTTFEATACCSLFSLPKIARSLTPLLLAKLFVGAGPAFGHPSRVPDAALLLRAKARLAFRLSEMAKHTSGGTRLHAEGLSFGQSGAAAVTTVPSPNIAHDPRLTRPFRLGKGDSHAVRRGSVFSP